MTFLEMLQDAQRRNASMLCVGLDPEPSRFPASLKGDASRIYDFCARIADATADLAIAFKPQIAYFAAHRAEDQLERLIAHIHEVAPGVPVIHFLGLSAYADLLHDRAFLGAVRNTALYVALVVPAFANHGLWAALMLFFVARGVTMGRVYACAFDPASGRFGGVTP